MRLTPEQIQSRFDREIGCQRANDVPGLEARSITGGDGWLTRKCAIAFAQRLAADLQAPPTGEEVADLRSEVRDAAMAAFNDFGSPAARRRFDEVVAAYGALCAAAARAEAGKAADVLKRLESAAIGPGVGVEVTKLQDNVAGERQWVADMIGRMASGTGETPEAAISAALDQLDAEKQERKP